ncbi:30S ribosomal protein S21 [Gemmata sp. JC717]|uniref:30S ribosomal protein S21 n=1 Tax=Gemmata algarum TaxID=2975278 RepID=UPI0021BA5884|nr:30S ribosomal protein S21 [Gemmata algarum]MDY3556994.1 30S ribosomal protein S21 [Gemmata algarum]
MSVKVIVRDGESIADALKRFRRLVQRAGPPGTNVKKPKWHKNQLTFYLKPSERRRRDEIRDQFETYAGECARRRVVCVIRRKTKRRKEHFGNIPVVAKYPPR